MATRASARNAGKTVNYYPPAKRFRDDDDVGGRPNPPPGPQGGGRGGGGGDSGDSGNRNGSDPTSSQGSSQPGGSSNGGSDHPDSDNGGGRNGGDGDLPQGSDDGPPQGGDDGPPQGGDGGPPQGGVPNADPNADPNAIAQPAPDNTQANGGGNADSPLDPDDSDARIALVVDQWKAYIQSVIPLDQRNQRYAEYFQMYKIAKAGRSTYGPDKQGNAVLNWQTLDHYMTQETVEEDSRNSYVALKNQALGLVPAVVFIIPPLWDDSIDEYEEDFIANTFQTEVQQSITDRDFKEVQDAWDQAIARTTGSQAGNGSEDFQALFDTMKDQAQAQDQIKPAYGPRHARNVAAWRNIQNSASINSLSGNTRGRFEDIRSRVMDFHTRFGVLLNCHTMPEAGWDDQSCETMVRAKQNEMISIGDAIWARYQDFVYDATDTASLAPRLDLRNDLKKIGFDFAPHEEDPPAQNITTRAQRARNIGLGADRSGVSGDWTAKEVLCQNENAQVTLWLQYGESGDIVDRMIIKDTILDQERFNKESIWLPQTFRRIVKEEALTRYLSSLPDCNNIVASQGYAIYESLFMHRIYMEYCALGDIEGLVRRYQNLDRQQAPDAKGNYVDFVFPKRLLWAIFDGLTTALCFLHFGSGNPSAPAANHDAILHRDLKPANLFLAAPEETSWSGIPNPKLGDFGIATRLSYLDSDHRGMGTVGYQAPEILDYDNESDDELSGVATTDKMSPKVDVWSLGKVMIALMNLNLDYNVYQFDDSEPSFSDGVATRYGPELCGLVQRCLNMDHNLRPSISEVRNIIRTEIERDGRNMKTDGPSETDFEILNFSEDMYKLRTAL